MVNEGSLLKVVLDAQVTFDTDAQGKARQAILRRNGLDRLAKRIDDAQAAVWIAALAKKAQGSNARARVGGRTEPPHRGSSDWVGPATN